MKRTGHKIVTSFEYPPIPIRSMDWSAVLSDYDGGDIDYDTQSRDPIGRGPTELSAVADLLDQLRDLEEDRTSATTGS